MKIKNSLVCAFALAASMLTTGCKVPEKVAYFQDDTELISQVVANPITIKPDNQLVILVKTKDESVDALFNFIYGTNQIAVYTVSPEGTIDFPMLGSIKLGGMTRAEAAGYIRGELMGRDLVKDPTVVVQFDNMGVDVLGEVNKPGRVDIKQDHMTLLDALSRSGDLTLNGKRENVKVIRQENGGYKVYTVDLTNLKELAKSPVYALQSNDVIYVEPNDMKKRQATVNGNNVYSTSFWISVVSLITSAVTTVGVFVKK